MIPEMCANLPDIHTPPVFGSMSVQDGSKSGSTLLTFMQNFNNHPKIPKLHTIIDHDPCNDLHLQHSCFSLFDYMTRVSCSAHQKMFVQYMGIHGNVINVI